MTRGLDPQAFFSRHGAARGAGTISRKVLRIARADGDVALFRNRFLHMALPAHLSRAYRHTRYSVAGFDLAIGRRSGALDGVLAGLGVRDAVLITAWNPRSRRMPKLWNERMMAALRHRLGSTPALPAYNEWRGWAEEQLLVIGDRRRLAVLGRCFRQAALVGLRRGQGVRLLPLV
jgi:hypothetical protein